MSKLQAPLSSRLCTLQFSGFVASGCPEAVIEAIRRRFDATGHPAKLKLVQVFPYMRSSHGMACCWPYILMPTVHEGQQLRRPCATTLVSSSLIPTTHDDAAPIAGRACGQWQGPRAGPACGRGPRDAASGSMVCRFLVELGRPVRMSRCCCLHDAECSIGHFICRHVGRHGCCIPTPSIAASCLCRYGLSPEFLPLIRAGKLDAWNLPFGCISQMIRDSAAGRVGPVTRIGVGTYVDEKVGNLYHLHALEVPCAT